MESYHGSMTEFAHKGGFPLELGTLDTLLYWVWPSLNVNSHSLLGINTTQILILFFTEDENHSKFIFWHYSELRI